MVVILHVTGDGGILSANKENFLSYNFIFLLRSFSYCAVNCFALITGFCMIDSDYKFTKFFSHWLQVFFYCAVVTICFVSIPYFAENYPFSKKQVIKSFFPILGDNYWYFTAYSVLFFMIPFLNELVKAVSKNQLETLLLLFFILFSVVPFICLRDIFKIYHTFMWLAIFYVAGAYIKKYNARVPVKLSLLLIISANVFILLLENAGSCLLQTVLHNRKSLDFLLFRNDNPFVVIHSVSVFLLFLSFRMGDNLNIIRNAGKVSFDVYLIHAQPLIYNSFIKGKFLFAESENPLAALFYALGISLAIYIFCSLVGFLRVMLFTLLHVDSLAKKLINKEN